MTGTTQLTHDGASKLTGWADLPPPLLTDGSRIYFDEGVDANDRLVQVSAEGGETVPIEIPFKFEGSSEIAPNRPELLIGRPPSSPGGVGLWVLPVPGGQPHRVGSILVEDATWSPDGTAIFYSFKSDIFRANGDGSEPRKILTTKGIPSWLRFSPDGSVLRLSIFDSKSRMSSLWEARPDGSGLRQLLAGWSNPTNECCGNWTSDGKYFIFQATRDGVTNLWAIREKADLWQKVSHAPMQLTVGQMTAQGPLPSKDGTKVFFIGANRRSELVRYDAKAHVSASYLPGLSVEGVSFSANGTRVAYVSYPDGALWQSKTDGSDRHELSFAPAEVGLPRWSPDGTQIAFSSRVAGKPWQMFVVPAEGGDAQQLTSGDSDGLDPTWSPDGNSLAFGGYAFAMRHFKGDAIHIINLKTRQVTDVPESMGLFSPRWSPDGRYMLAMTADFQKLVVYDFTRRMWEDLIKMPASYPSWSHDGKYVYFNNAFDKDLPVYRIGLSDRKLEHIVNLSDAGHLAEGHLGWWSGLSPDDGILAARDISIEEIYALNTKFP